MKIEREMRFPHPVLWTETADYSDGLFAVDVAISENTGTGGLEFKCEVSVTEPVINKLCAAGSASVGLSVVCLETYYNRLIEVPFQGGALTVSPGQLRGQVLIRPLIWATNSVVSVASSGIHKEFGDGPFSFLPSAVLALGDEIVIDVGAEKLAPIGSIFSLALDDKVPENQVAIQIEEEKIQIVTCKPTLEWLSNMRNNAQGKAILLNGVYLPVLMSVLDVIRKKDPVHEQKRWHRVITAKLTVMGLSAESGDLLQIAQSLFKSPLGKLDTFVELGK